MQHLVDPKKIKPGDPTRMIPFTKAPVDVSVLVDEIDNQPELWDQYRLRTKAYDSPNPHATIHDIWIRYNDWKHYNPKKPRDFHKQHDSVFYPAYYKLPAIRPHLFDLIRAVKATRLGGVLITRIPPGHSVGPHKDLGWHAGYYRKFAVQLKGGPQQGFHFDGETIIADAGEVYEFDNAHLHWVTNDSDRDRMTMIVCLTTS
jgi:hypothetical protein